MTESVTFFTIAARNYLAQACVLGNSVRQVHPDSQFIIFLMDDAGHAHEDEIRGRGLSVLYPEQIAMPDFRQFVFKYSVVEACTGIKPFVMEFLLRKYADKVIYLDPDILCFRRFDEVLAALHHYSIVITPHSISPHDDRSIVSDRAHLTSGAYNLGFIAVSKEKPAVEFLTWWKGHLREECLVDSCGDLFVDQKWIDLVPSYFKDVLVLKNPAYNIAYWNLHERDLEKRRGTYYLLRSDEPAAFIHFSGFNKDDILGASRAEPGSAAVRHDKVKDERLMRHPDFMEAFREYATLLGEAGYEKYCKVPYEYRTYSNGEVVSPLERILFLKSPEWQKRCPDPFEVSGNSFWSFCRGRGIRSRAAAKSKEGDEAAPGAGNAVRGRAGANGWVEFMGRSLIRRGIRIMIRILGVDRYLKVAGFCAWQFQLANHDFLLNEKRAFMKNEGELKKGQW